MRKTLVSAVTVLGLTLAGGAIVTTPAVAEPQPVAAAAKPGAPGIGDPYFPTDGNGGYDVGHYSLRIRYRPAKDSLSGLAVIRATATQRLSRFNLDLDGLRVDAVRVNGRKASWSRAKDELRVTPAKSLRKGAGFTVRVRYHGVPKVLDESFSQGGVFPTADGAVVIGEPHVADTWFPVNDHPLDKATYTVHITVPRGLEAVSNGDLVKVTRSKRSTTWHWVETAPMASYLATATVGQFNLKSYTADGIRIIDAIDPVLYRQTTPRTGRRFIISGGDDSAYKRLTRTIAVPAGGGRLKFAVTRDTESDFDFFFVEAHPVGSNAWTTLPDLNGHTSKETGGSCPFWLDLHPFLGHYERATGEETCDPRGTTGAWNAASGRSDGYEKWAVDLSAYAGQQVEISLAVASDDGLSYPGVYVDDIVGPGGAGSTSFEEDGNVLDGWTVSGPPAGSPGNATDWRTASRPEAKSVGERAQAALAREPEYLNFLSGVFGPYPFKEAGGIVDDDPNLGYALENQTRPIYSKAFFSEPSDDDTSVVVHELAHQWTGDSLSVARWKEIWLNEGFATYAEWLWSEHEGGDSAQAIFNSWAGGPADEFPWGTTIGDPGAEGLFDFSVYIRGGMTLHALRRQIGDPAFFQLLKQWTTTYRNGNVTTAQFQALAEKISGQDLDAFFTAWLYTATKPAGVAASATSRSRLDAKALSEKLRSSNRRR